MASLLGKLVTFARSPQGQKLMKRAEKIAEDPKTRKEAEGLVAEAEKKA